MQRFFYRWLVLVLVGFVFCGCSEKVESVEKAEVVDPFDGNNAVVDPFGGNVAIVEEQVAEEAEIDPVEAIIANRLRSFIIPRIDFEDRTVEEALDFIRLRASEIDPPVPNESMGFNLVIRRPKTATYSGLVDQSSKDLLAGGELNSLRIPELRLRNVSIAAALRYICMMTNLQCKMDERVITIFTNDPNAAWDDVGSLLEENGDTTVISQKLSQIRLPRVDFENTSIHEAIDFLRLRSAELDVTSIDAGRKGINFVLYIPKGMETPYIDKLQIRDASFEEVLKEICSKTGMRYELDAYSVILIPKDLK